MENPDFNNRSFLIKNVNIVDINNEIIKKKDILIIDGIFKGFDKKPKKDHTYKVIDAKGSFLISDTIDIHVHLRDPGYLHKETLESGLRASAKGGFTRVVAMPNTLPVVDQVNVFKDINERSENIKGSSLYQSCSLTKDLDGKINSDFNTLIENGAWIFSDDGKSVCDSMLMKRVLQSLKDEKVSIFLHSQNELFPPENPDSEILGIYRDILISEITDTPVHIQHVSTEKSISLIRDAKKRGVKLTCEVCPHHLFLNSENSDIDSSYFKVNPPLRTPRDSNELIKALFEGDIDVIASDHAPHSKDEKMLEYKKAPYGLSGVETLIPVCYTELVKKRGMDIFTFTRLISKNPLNISKIDSYGLEEGKAPFFTLVDTNEEYSFNEDNLISKGKNNPFIDYRSACSVKMTVVEGEIVWHSF